MTKQAYLLRRGHRKFTSSTEKESQKFRGQEDHSCSHHNFTDEVAYQYITTCLHAHRQVHSSDIISCQTGGEQKSRHGKTED